MGRTEREAYLELRARYLRLVSALRTTREYNPETLEAIERILPPETLPARQPRQKDRVRGIEEVLPRNRRVAA